MKVFINKEKCIECGICETVCPHAVFSIKSGVMSVVDEPACIECGACDINCPVGAIGVQSGVG